MFSDIEMNWKPFGYTLTYGEWEGLFTWFVQKNMRQPLNTMEKINYAKYLYP